MEMAAVAYGTRVVEKRDSGPNGTLEEASKGRSLHMITYQAITIRACLVMVLRVGVVCIVFRVSDRDSRS